MIDLTWTTGPEDHNNNDNNKSMTRVAGRRRWEHVVMHVGVSPRGKCQRWSDLLVRWCLAPAAVGAKTMSTSSSMRQAQAGEGYFECNVPE